MSANQKKNLALALGLTGASFLQGCSDIFSDEIEYDSDGCIVTGSANWLGLGDFDFSVLGIEDTANTPIDWKNETEGIQAGVQIGNKWNCGGCAIQTLENTSQESSEGTSEEDNNAIDVSKNWANLVDGIWNRTITVTQTQIQDAFKSCRFDYETDDLESGEDTVATEDFQACSHRKCGANRLTLDNYANIFDNYLTQWEDLSTSDLTGLDKDFNCAICVAYNMDPSDTNESACKNETEDSCTGSCTWFGADSTGFHLPAGVQAGTCVSECYSSSFQTETTCEAEPSCLWSDGKCFLEADFKFLKDAIAHCDGPDNFLSDTEDAGCQ